MAQVQKMIKTKKDFTYSHGICSLSFTLNVDEDSELKSFHKLLKQAVVDVEELLGQLQKGNK